MMAAAGVITGLAKSPAMPSPRDVYAPIVRGFLPGVAGRELSLRCSTLLMRDRASAWALHCSEEAYGCLQQIERLAHQYAYTSMSIARLQQLQLAMLRLTSTAAELDDFAKSGAPEGGGPT